MSNRGVTFYSYGIGSPGNYFSGTGVANTSIGAQGYRYVGGGVYMDVATAKGVDFGTVYDNSLAQEQVGFSSGSVAREFVDRIKSGFGLFSYQLYNRINWVLSIGNPGLYAAIGGGYKTLNPTAGSFTFGGVIIATSGSNINWSEVGSSSVGILLGAAEIGIGLGGEVFSGGLSTAIIVDGSIRVGSNITKIGLILAGNSNIAGTTPSNGGGWIGKGIDMATGANYGQIGVGQGLGSFTNDFSTFVVTGGNALNLSKMVTFPSLLNGYGYGMTLFGTPYGVQSDLLNWNKYQRK
jgi:hypothetical protein